MTLRPAVLIVPLALAAALAGAAAGQTPPTATPPAPDAGAGEAMPDPRGLPATPEAARAWAEGLVARYDANADGAITGDELAVPAEPTPGALGGPRLRAMILRADADGDSRVTVEELTAGTQRLARRMNRGGEGGGAGMLTPPRAAEAVQPWAARVFTRLDADQDGALTGGELADLARPEVAAMGGSRLRAMIVQSDANRDSRISTEEWVAGAQRAFTRMDRDGDGRLDDTELPRPAAAPPVVIPPASTAPEFPDASPDGG